MPQNTAGNRPYRDRPLRPRRLEWGPPTRSHDRDQSAGNDPHAARALTNIWIRDADTETPLAVGRPGLTQMGAQLGSSGKRVGQRGFQFSQSNGTEKLMGFCGGQMYLYTWGTNSWAEIVTVANLTSASITLSETAKVYCVNFANQLIVSDGVNTPWAWDGTANGGLTKLTNAPVGYGIPWVYYAKLFFIKNTERTTIVWSEEGTPNTGYEAGGYNNAWTLRQTATEGFFAAGATNSQLYLFRPNSYTLITGEVTTDFASTGVRDGNEKVGTRSPGGVQVIGEEVYFFTSDKRVMRAAGTETAEVGVGVRSTLAAINTTKLASVESAIVDFGDQGLRLLFGFPETGSDNPNAYACINPATGIAEGVWRGWSCTSLTTIKDTNGDRKVMHFGGSTPTTVDEGYSYWHDVPMGTTWNDGFQANTITPISHACTTSVMGESSTVDQSFLRCDIVFHTPSSLTSVQVNVKTPRGTWHTTVPVTLTFAAGVALWDVALWDVDVWSDDALGERHVAVGLKNVAGRWCQVELLHGVANEQFQVQTVSVLAEAIDEKPGAY